MQKYLWMIGVPKSIYFMYQIQLFSGQSVHSYCNGSSQNHLRNSSATDVVIHVRVLLEVGQNLFCVI